MNLELPFAEGSSALDEYLAEIDRALDALFLDEVDGAIQRLRAAVDGSDGGDAEKAVA